MKIRFLYNFLHINDSKEILLPGDVRGLIELDNMVIVFVCNENIDKEINVRNSAILAFDSRGNKIWHTKETRESNGNVVAFSDISLRDDGEIILGSTRGLEFIVNTEDGSLTPVCSNERPW